MTNKKSGLYDGLVYENPVIWKIFVISPFLILFPILFHLGKSILMEIISSASGFSFYSPMSGRN